ncbi:ATP-binding cassette domain-containing protein [Spiribacter sp. C176]|uniref:ATP-binding cassette domain-containing protein n=1 Tax=Spiribacter salilacus TaxID=2664894 RepID=A0A6N7QPU4_9GAMM|nr:ATP-binding cassette domain-containing protein [Spiribacter salilacus]
MSGPLIEAKDVSVKIGDRRILDHIELAINAKEIVTVVGPNGSGKSTLLRTLIGAIKPDKGQIKRQHGLTIGYVPQKLHIDPTLPMTVRRFLNLPRAHDQSTIDLALQRAGIPGRANDAMTALSGGQFQRALMARALLDTPDLLMLDEAAQGLDQTGVADFYKQIEDIRNQLGCGVLMVSHDLHVVMRAADRVICLNQHICCQGHPEAVTTDPAYHALFGTDTDEVLALFRHDPHQHPHQETESTKETTNETPT